MKGFKKTLTVMLAGVMVSALIPGVSQADWDRHHHGNSFGHHDKSHFGFRISILPANCESFWMGSSRYYYRDGFYYTRYAHEYVIVEPPVGAIVRNIPLGYQTIAVNGITYYTDNGVYYVYTPRGYRVVPAPVVYQAPVVVSQPSVVMDAASDESYTINIPNSQGSNTPVVIKRSGSGYIGPQGEYYNDFPRVAQLKAMYVK